MTLLELLLVIAIITVLGVLLFSLDQRIRRSTKKIHNVEKQRTIGFAVFAYANDHSGQIPGNTLRGARTRMIGSGMHTGAAVRKLFSRENFKGMGEGTLDYLPSADCLYGPLSQLHRERRPGEFFFYKETNAYRSGYTAYSLPRNDANGAAPLLEECYNDRLSDNPRAPLFSDLINWEEFTGTEISVLFLDGSLRDFPKEEVEKYRSYKDWLKLFSGIR